MPYMENRLDIIGVRTLLRAWGDNSRGGRLGGGGGSYPAAGVGG